MADILDLIWKLLRLSSSDNENEARSSALTAARLILEHKVELFLPGQTPKAPPVEPLSQVRHSARPHAPPRRVKDLGGSWWYFHEEGARFPGHCIHCALPMFSGTAAYMGEAGCLHVGCWNERQHGKATPGPTPSHRQSSTLPGDEGVSGSAAVDDLWETLGYDKKG